MLSRREFVSLCLASGCSVYAFSAMVQVVANNCSGTDRIDAPRIIGEWYLRMFPEEHDKRRLIRLLEHAVPGIVATDEIGDARLIEQRVKNACKNDYERGDTVYLGGWLLARTEVRLCALAVVS